MTLLLLLCLLLAALFGMYALSHRLIPMFYEARPAEPLEMPYQLVQELAVRAGLPGPAVYIINEECPNAFAAGRNPRHAAIAVTRGLVNLLEREELSAVLAHEMAHLVHRNIFAAPFNSLLAGLAAFGANLCRWLLQTCVGCEREAGPRMRHFREHLLPMVLVPAASRLCQVAAARSLEYQADALGGVLCGNPLWLVAALRRIDSYHRSRTPVDPAVRCTADWVRPFLQFGHWFIAHPPLMERIQRLEAAACGVHPHEFQYQQKSDWNPIHPAMLKAGLKSGANPGHLR